MKTTIFVVSDLHLGGEPGFEMCSATGQERLAGFFTWVGSQGGQDPSVHLVLAGDVVDFLAERDPSGDWSAFTATSDEACRKLGSIMARTAGVWDALRTAVGRGVSLTILLGNHDIELSLPAVRRVLLERIGPGRVEFIYDNEAFRVGPVLIEHGNRYDAWNVVAHDALRRIRSHASREEPADAFRAQPGSVLVARVMNRIKETYAFVDLLKPETSAVLPILAVLAPSLWIKAWPLVYAGARAAWRERQYDKNGLPTADDFVAARREDGTPRPDHDADLVASSASSEGRVPTDEFPDNGAFKEALALAHAADAEGSDDVAFRGEVATALLLRALRRWCVAGDITWNVAEESKTYRVPAQALAARGFKVVVFGHTHLAKSVALPGAALYLNTGTWANLMRLSPTLLSGSDDAAKKELVAFLDALRDNRIERWRRPVPTFARIAVEGEHVASAGVFFFDGPGRIVPLSTEGVRERLVGP